MKVNTVVLILSLFALIGCAQTMTISESLLGNQPASLTIDSQELSTYVSVPLINHKFVKVELYAFPTCVEGDTQLDNKKHLLGRARLTPANHSQSLAIPSGKKLLVTLLSEENFAGNVYSCWTRFSFLAEKDESYLLKATPHKSGFSNQKCSARLLRQENGNQLPVDSVVGIDTEYKGFWSGHQYKYCPT